MAGVKKKARTLWLALGGFNDRYQIFSEKPRVTHDGYVQGEGVCCCSGYGASGGDLSDVPVSCDSEVGEGLSQVSQGAGELDAWDWERHTGAITRVLVLAGGREGAWQMTQMIYPFSEQEALECYEESGANCGPNALAFALQMSLRKVIRYIPDFLDRRYTSPTMMEIALAALGRKVQKISIRSEQLHWMELLFHERVALVRIQWGGPWIKDGKPQKWAARQTHWIVTWIDGFDRLVFDVNGGINRFENWRYEIVPALAASVPRCDGTWYPANIWRLVP